MCAEALAPSQRHTYSHNGRLIYEWDQTLTEVNLYIQVPEGVRAKHLAVNITAQHLSVGIKGNPPYIDVRGRELLDLLRAKRPGASPACCAPSSE